MDLPLLLVLAAAALALAAAGFFAARAKSASAALSAVTAERDGMRQELQSLAADRAAADERARGAERRAEEFAAARATAEQAASVADLARIAAQREAALAEQAVAEMRQQMTDWEKTKAEFVKAAESATLESGAKLSSKLLEDHKRESEAAKKAAAEEVAKTTGALTESVRVVVESAAALRERQIASDVTIERVNRALSNPVGAGQVGEMILENMLRQFGLERDRDFVIQYDTAGGALRPDAVVFLPGDAALVIDSKASKFLLELASATDESSRAAALRRLAETMNGHLKALAGKDYHKAVAEQWKRSGRGAELRFVVNAMFLPTDGALEHLREADAGFFARATAAQIIPVGPNSLASLLSIARLQIDIGQRAENHEKIVAAAEALVDSVGVALGHMSKIGKGLKSAADGFEDLAGSIESRLVPRLRALAKYNIKSSKGAPEIPHFKVIEIKDTQFIEGELEAEGRQKALPPA